MHHFGPRGPTDLTEATTAGKNEGPGLGQLVLERLAALRTGSEGLAALHPL